MHLLREEAREYLALAPNQEKTKNSTFRHSDTIELPDAVLLAAKMKYESNASDDDDFNVIFNIRTAQTRNSTTSGAMREPHRTLTCQGNMNKYLEPDAGCSESAVSYLECRTVGGKYICPYCNN